MTTPWEIQAKTVVVTGGTKGIGYETARGLATLGATVLIVGRDAARGDAAVTVLQQQTGNTKIAFKQADLSSLAEVRRLAAYITTQYPHVQVLVNNAGGGNLQRNVTADGLEATFATNHLAPFLLTNLLLPVLHASSPARIVNVNSVMHRPGHLDFADLQAESGYERIRAYQQAKLANLYFTYALARRLRGTNVTVNAADPLGTAQATKSMSASFSPAQRLVVTGVFLPLLSRFLTTERAAQSSIYLASSPAADGLNGTYVNFRKRVVRSSPASYDEATAEKLWQVSAELTGLEPKRLSVGA